MKTAAFFDLDGTLLTVNSGKLWVRRERREGRLSLWQLTQAIFFLAGYRFGLTDMNRVMRKAVQTIKGLEEESVRRWTRKWYEQEVKHLAAPGGFDAIADHREKGHLLVLLTSSSPYESEAACEHFGLDAALSSRYGVRDGRFSGELIMPLCYGHGKVLIAERFASQHGLDLDSSYFYTDSITDLPMLLRVGRPRVVNPDPRLSLAARKYCCPVPDWRG